MWFGLYYLCLFVYFEYRGYARDICGSCLVLGNINLCCIFGSNQTLNSVLFWLTLLLSKALGFMIRSFMVFVFIL
uniref:Uncharacterized protein n=1 Tax=Sphaeramia orbicularis TaxID=375764 RepID=A0A672ZIA1_9TELE